MNSTNNTAQLEQTIIDTAEQSLAMATQHANPNNLDDYYKAMSLMAKMSIEEVREELMLDALTEVQQYTALIETDSGLTEQAKKALLDIRDRARMIWQNIADSKMAASLN